MLPDRYRLSHDTADMDRDRIHAWLSEESYWARGRSRATQDAAIDGSLNFGIFDGLDGGQVAYALLVTGDAHALYSRFGFEPLDAPKRFLAKVNPNPSGPPAIPSTAT